jgi:hypothetical protein
MMLLTLHVLLDVVLVSVSILAYDRPEVVANVPALELIPPWGDDAQSEASAVQICNTRTLLHCMKAMMLPRQSSKTISTP